MTAKKILIVEDNPALLRGLKDNFQAQGYQVRTANDGEKGLDALLRDPPDLLLLDLMLPKLNGYEICRLARSRRLNTPIIMLSAKAQEDDIVRGLELGADDYVTKPFGIRELMARARRLSRGGGLAQPCLIAGPSRELPVTPPGLGVRQPSGAFSDSTHAPKRQRAGALQDADAPTLPPLRSENPVPLGEPPIGQEPMR
jgi:DNA-binding response OmpR family regulator